MSFIGPGVLSAIARAFSPFNAFISLAIEDAKVVEGIAFQVRKCFTIAQSEVLDIVLDPAGFTGSTLVFQPLGFDAIGGPFRVDIFAGITADDDGTLITVFNRNFNIGGPSEMIVRQDPSNIDIGAAIGPLEILIPSDGTGAVGTSGASSADSIVSVLDPDLKYLLRITNTDTTAEGSIGVKTDHFEVP